MQESVLMRDFLSLPHWHITVAAYRYAEVS